MTPEWTITNFIVQAIAGIFGAHAAAIAAHEHRFGFLGHSLAGLGAGAIGGFFLQRIVMTTVTATGDAMPVSAFDAAIYQGLTGAVVGAIAMMVVGFIRSEITKKPTL